jgi:hypothetical protein
MPPKTQQKSTPVPVVSGSGYVCAVYGGCMKLGYVKYITTENEQVEEELEKYKNVYGSKVTARYIKVNEIPKDALQKIYKRLSDKKIDPDHGDIYELNITKAVKEMKDACSVSKAFSWGLGMGTSQDNQSNDDDSTEQNSKKNVVQVSKVVSQPKIQPNEEEIETEDYEDVPPVDEEQTEDTEFTGETWENSEEPEPEPEPVVTKPVAKAKTVVTKPVTSAKATSAKPATAKTVPAKVTIPAKAAATAKVATPAKTTVTVKAPQKPVVKK